MFDIALYLFAASAFLILHTYFLYPMLMMLFYSREKMRGIEFTEGDDLPSITVLIAAYNEEKVIAEKIESIFNTTYSISKLKVLLGSDASTDNTDAIVEKLCLRFPNLQLIKFTGRVGKIGIINHLESLSDGQILVLTDANVMLKPDTLFELIKKFKDEKVGIVAANIIKVSVSEGGISRQEKKYISLENKLKACESNGFDFIMGAEGGCYAIKSGLFSKVPLKFIVDDFFVTLQVIINGKSTLFNKNAVCIEGIANDAASEYKRKVRISSGNFQNLFYFKKILLRFWTPLAFAFWSHKVLRWLTPFFLITALVTSGILMNESDLFLYIFLLQLIGLALPLLNLTFRFTNNLLKFVSHFYLMNFALLIGFFRFTKGIKSSVWQPVKRNA